MSDQVEVDRALKVKQQAGGSVVASDLTPELLESGRRQAAERGIEIEWREGDAESLPFSDDEFDVVHSCIFEKPENFRDYFKANYGPNIAVFQSIADDSERVAALDHDLDELARRSDHGVGTTVMEWEYLVLTAQKDN